MKISYRTHPSLALLEQDPNLGIEIVFDELDRPDWEMLKSFFVPKLSKFIGGIDKNNIIKPSENFIYAAWQAGKLVAFKNDEEYSKELVGESGVVLLKDKSVFFIIKLTPENNVVIEIVIFDNRYNTLLEFVLPIGESNNKQSVWVSKVVHTENLPEGLRQGMGYYLTTKYFILTLLLFRKYAQVEIKNLPAGRKVKGIICDYKNETKVNVEYLDSKWFTTLVKSDGFDVRGHFRLQPKKKNGEWTKEMIWINPFVKTGYTAPARKLKQDT